MSTSHVKCDFSTHALLWPIGRPNEPTFYFPVRSVNWGIDRVRVSLIPESTREITFLKSLRTGTGNIVIAHGTSVALATILDVEHFVGTSETSFLVTFHPDQIDFDSRLEIGFGDVGVDQLAVMRARRLLLDDYPVRETSDINEVTRDLFIGGQGTVLRITESIFPRLYTVFGHDPLLFLNIAWIAAVTQLTLSNCVAQIEELALEFVADQLQVKFKGSRHKRYTNVPAFVVAVEGVCKLSSHKVGFSFLTADMDQLGPRLHGISSKVSLVRATPEIAKRAAELVSELESLLAALPPR